MSMFLTGKNGEVWQLDETLRKTAEQLTEKYKTMVGYVNLSHIVFVRCVGSPQKDWLGKIWYMRKPLNIAALYVANLALSNRVYDEELSDTVLYEPTFDIRYIIAINDDEIMGTGNAEKVTEATLLHEMKHIKMDMDGLEKHDIKDFKDILSIYGLDYTKGSFKTGEEESEV